MKPKKLGLVLLPMIPLTAIGVVEVVDRALAPEPVKVIAVTPAKPTPPKPIPPPVQPPQPPPAK